MIHTATGVMISSKVLEYNVEMAALRLVCRCKHILPLDYLLTVARLLFNPRMEARPPQLVVRLSIYGRGERFLTVTLLSSR